uniref:Solute carrier family 17 (Sodium phosphate), member 3 n=2 Tax=Nothobranchius rachovii TaxID=451742 RepID=A0A1A8S1D5_9TELE
MSPPGGCSINVDSSDESEDTKSLIQNDPAPPQCCSARLNLSVLMFLGFSVVYGLRVNLSVAMVAMVNATNPSVDRNTSVAPACPLPPGTENTSDTLQQPDGTPQYTWNPETQGWLLGAFFFGEAGYSTDSELCTCGSRTGVTFPAMMAMWARWAPPLERSRLMTLSGSGGAFGAFVALSISGFICEKLGWPAVFYLCGGAGCFWALFWFFLVADDPRTHPRISEEEREYIINSVGAQGTGHGWSVPLLSMVLSVPLWAIIITQMCFNWTFYTLLTSLPTYMNSILHFDLQSNGFLSALPYLGNLLVSLLSGVAADALIERKVFSITIVRKIFTFIGLLLPAVFLVPVGYVGCSHILTVTFLTLSTSLGGTSSPGVFINQIDIAPRYAGFLLGITNTCGTIPGVMAPIVTGYFTKDHSMDGWRKVFWVAAGINVGGAIFFTIFGSGKIQKWAETEEERAEPERTRNGSAGQ